MNARPLPSVKVTRKVLMLEKTPYGFIWEQSQDPFKQHNIGRSK